MQEEIKNIVNDLSKHIKRVDVLKKQAFSQLNEQQLNAIQPMQKDLAGVSKALKNGDTEALTNYLKKYADINRPK